MTSLYSGSDYPLRGHRSTIRGPLYLRSCRCHPLCHSRKTYQNSRQHCRAGDFHVRYANCLRWYRVRWPPPPQRSHAKWTKHDGPIWKPDECSTTRSVAHEAGRWDSAEPTAVSAIRTTRHSTVSAAKCHVLS